MLIGYVFRVLTLSKALEHIDRLDNGKNFYLSYMIAKSIELNLKPLISDTSYFLNKKSDNWLYTLRGY